MKPRDMREMSDEERQEQLQDWRNELMEEYGRAAMGGSPPSPGKICWIRRNIARMLTVMKEEGERNE
ncbi:MAG TPA: 50S ribosomal protein L29 [Thermoplasmatales archaeon]|nr:50S ribosomal protein L29 [Candidatus Thermoplasmatota archaeon]MDD5778099.1 50S ribosomal protein L29 [Candidatus Thermoplasmatota archaeon]HDS59345.1 50S ribosomal protein L29 [Thermoplasmatales archaeon]